MDLETWQLFRVGCFKRFWWRILSPESFVAFIKGQTTSPFVPRHPVQKHTGITRKIATDELRNYSGCSWGRCQDGVNFRAIFPTFSPSFHLSRLFSIFLSLPLRYHQQYSRLCSQQRGETRGDECRREHVPVGWMVNFIRPRIRKSCMSCAKVRAVFCSRNVGPYSTYVRIIAVSSRTARRFRPTCEL